jgi:hypothetical protein
LVLASCNPGQASFGSVGGFIISNVAFDNATGLATVGSSISLGGTITVGGVALDNTPAQAVVTSVASISATNAAPATITTLSLTSTPPFANFGSATALSVSIAAGNVTATGALSRDLATAVLATNSLGTTNSLQVNSAIFSNAALARAELVNAAGTVIATAAPTVFTGGFVTFGNLTAAQTLQSFTVNVVFNGTASVDGGVAGTYTYSFAAIGDSGLSGNGTAPGALSGTTAAIQRTGLNVDINSIQPSVAQGARTYSSLLRVVNTSASTPGPVQIVLRNNTDGTILGTYTSPSIPAGGSRQIGSAEMETGAGIVPTAGVLYKATITGAIQGYIQHVNWNQDAGFFSDLSGRRNSTNGTNN